MATGKVKPPTPMAPCAAVSVGELSEATLPSTPGLAELQVSHDVIDASFGDVHSLQIHS